MTSTTDKIRTAVPAAEVEPAAGFPASHHRALGATLRDDGTTEFRVWAPKRDRIEVHVIAPVERRVPMTKHDDGYFDAVVDCGEGARYFFTIDGGDDRPDPASRLQPESVHGPSEVVGRDFEWHDADWRGIALEDHVIYELHVGTFTEEGTFDAVIPHLDSLRELGITAVELLPVAQFPGTRNWGYDGVFVNAAQSSYGGPRALKRLVDACHARGLAILLDVVYNHLGPEGNYLAEYGAYFTDRYKTPWGLALNFDGAQSDYVRWYFIQNALQWVDEFHFDGLRVDAVHAIVDHSAEPFLQDLCEAVRERAAKLGRQIHTIAESDLNDPRVITPKRDLGLGFDSQWADDFHHSLHALLTGEQDGYYEGFGKPSDLARVLTTGYLYIGQHSTYRGRKYGAKPRTRNGAQFVISAQNHDQVGNRMAGDRLSTIVNRERLRLAAAAVVLAPFLPMLFMGEEYGETAPFQYFTSHSDADLIEAVRKGRREEFDDFLWSGEPPDPHDEETFRRSKLRRDELLQRDDHREMFALYRELLRIRRETPALHALDLDRVDAHGDDERLTLAIRRGAAGDQALVVFNFHEAPQEIAVPGEEVQWTRLAGASDATVRGGSVALPPLAFAVFARAT